MIPNIDINNGIKTTMAKIINDHLDEDDFDCVWKFSFDVYKYATAI